MNGKNLTRLAAAAVALVIPLGTAFAVAPSASAAAPAAKSAAALAPAWAPYTAYATGAVVTYNGVDYECRQGHTSLPGWEPANVPALWKVSGGGGQDQTAPSVPGSLRSTGVTGNSVSLAWNASTDNVAVTGYEVYRGTTLVTTTNGTTTTYTDTGLTAGTTYQYTVRARDAAGNRSNASNQISATTTGGGDPTAPSVPGNLRSTGVTATSVSLAWNASTDNVAVTGYEVYRGTTLVTTTNGTTTTYTDTGLTAATTYQYTVRARDAAGNRSEASNQISATTSEDGGGDDRTPPSVPGNLRSTGSSNSSIGLAWNASTDNVAVTGYEVYRGGTLVTTTNGTGTAYTDTGLTANTTYQYTVRARDAAGNRSNASNQISASTTGGQGGNKLLGYFVQWGIYQRGYHVKNIDTSGSASKLTHINYAFGNVQGGRCTIGDSYADYDRFYQAGESVDGQADTWDNGALRGNFNQLRKLKAKYPNLKVLFSFGGWTWSGGFGQAAANPAAFAESCYNLVEDPRWADVFDGIDIDWEYPNACGLTCDTSGPASLKNLMQALRNKFGQNYLITAAITADGTDGGKMDAADYAGAAQYVDWYNVMTYDFFGAWEAKGPTAPHSPLNSYTGIPIEGYHTEQAINKLKGKGIPASKLLSGIGFYGRGWTGVTQKEPGGTATGPAQGTYEQGIEDYKVLKTRCPSNGTVAGTAYAFCGNNWWSYDTPATIGSKMGWTKNQGLGGSFFWELSGDTTNGELITAMKNGLN
ncbi:glycosyl hydrolase family 18 protein [Spongiactinospora sp. TRM90649]|uniref:glycosyl hydrolase family 18 protein n=1 Tax=Spongiactinospora sp. TRM90649 TaxID=3031114 RepID=UPI0023F85C95|nr:glycosyl hydrolase family 18 protein [Spongiactinospora sp. TRM90649]MDF5752101.1 glycosyl hydrolase family 18 protein [Spongiactinospora sp. TRM90649]